MTELVDRSGSDSEEYRVELWHDTAMFRLYLDENAAVTRTQRVQRSNHLGPCPG